MLEASGGVVGKGFIAGVSCQSSSCSGASSASKLSNFWSSSPISTESRPSTTGPRSNATTSPVSRSVYHLK